MRQELSFQAAKHGQTVLCPLGNNCVCVLQTNHLLKTIFYARLMCLTFRIICVILQ